MENAQFENFGQYILLEKLASGGMAEVFLSKKVGASGVQKFVAVKRILPQYSESEDFIQMFKEEAKIAVNLSHSNVVSIYEFGVENGQFYLVMEYVEGRNLRQVLNKMKKLNQNFSLSQIVYIIKEVAAGLDHAHRCLDGSTGKPLNLIHRDMSPQNIMVSFEGETKIVDFGIAKASTQIENTKVGTLKGKFGYMSPEQAEGIPVDYRTDIFSLGTVLWELLGNDRLFLMNNEINTLRKIRDCKIPPLREINPNIPIELEKIVNKSLAKDRNLRYQNASEFQRDLSRFINRHDPDFSAQDFSVFVRTMFSQEILDSRKRLISYAQYIPVGTNAADQSQNDKRLVVKTGYFEVTEENNSSEFNNTSVDKNSSAFELDKSKRQNTNTDIENNDGSHIVALPTDGIHSQLNSERQLKEFSFSKPASQALSQSTPSINTDRTRPAPLPLTSNLKGEDFSQSGDFRLDQSKTNIKINKKDLSKTNHSLSGFVPALFVVFLLVGGYFLLENNPIMARTVYQNVCDQTAITFACKKYSYLQPAKVDLASQYSTLVIEAKGASTLLFVEGAYVGKGRAVVKVKSDTKLQVTAAQPNTNKRQEASVTVSAGETKVVTLESF